MYCYLISVRGSKSMMSCPAPPVSSSCSAPSSPSSSAPTFLVNLTGAGGDCPCICEEMQKCTFPDYNWYFSDLVHMQLYRWRPSRLLCCLVRIAMQFTGMTIGAKVCFFPLREQPTIPWPLWSWIVYLPWPATHKHTQGRLETERVTCGGAGTDWPWAANTFVAKNDTRATLLLRDANGNCC